jgi:hypothetical protein
MPVTPSIVLPVADPGVAAAQVEIPTTNINRLTIAAVYTAGVGATAGRAKIAINGMMRTVVAGSVVYLDLGQERELEPVAGSILDPGNALTYRTETGNDGDVKDPMLVWDNRPVTAMDEVDIRAWEDGDVAHPGSLVFRYIGAKE